MHLNEFSKTELNPVFSPRLNIDSERWPVSFVPFDSTSPIWVVAEYVVPAVIEAMHSGDSVLLLEAFVLDVVDIWPIMAPKEQTKMRSLVKDVLVRASRAHFSRYLKPNRSYESTKGSIGWDIVNNPLDMSSRKSSREMKRLRRLQSEFLEHLQTGKPVSPAPLDLFEDGALG